MLLAWIEPVGVVRDVCHGDPMFRYTENVAAHYTTEVPDDTVNGATLIDCVWSPPPLGPSAPLPPAPPDAWAALIDLGPFFDRFGAAKLPILASADATVQALVKDLQSRKWIDLQRTDVGQGLDILVSKALLTLGGKSAVLALPVEEDENFALRKVYF